MLPPLVLSRLVVAKAKAIYRALHPEPKRAVAELERRPAVVYLPLGADLGADET